MYPVSETNILYAIFASWKIQAYNHLSLPLLSVPEAPHWPPNSKGLAFYEKKKKLFCINCLI